MICKHCKEKYDENLFSETLVCPHCGASNPRGETPMRENGRFDWEALVYTILSVLVPIIGFFLAIVWCRSSPKYAKTAVLGATIGCIPWISMGILALICYLLGIIIL